MNPCSSRTPSTRGDAPAPDRSACCGAERHCVLGGGGNAGSEGGGGPGGGGGGAIPGGGAARCGGGGLWATVRRGRGLRIGLGGATGCSVTCTGLGTRAGGGADSQNEWSGTSPTVTCTVCGTNPILVIVTVWGSDGTGMAHGVRQVWPCAVRTSAPGGSDTNCSGWDCEDGFDDSQSGAQSGMAEQPASARLAISVPTTSLTRDVARETLTRDFTRDMALSVPET